MLGFCGARQLRIIVNKIENIPLRHASRHRPLDPSSLRPYYDRVPRPYHPAACLRTKLDNHPAVVSKKNSHLGNGHGPARDPGTSNTGRRDSHGGPARGLFLDHSQNDDVYRMVLCVCDSRSIHRRNVVHGVSPVTGGLQSSIGRSTTYLLSLNEFLECLATCFVIFQSFELGEVFHCW